MRETNLTMDHQKKMKVLFRHRSMEMGGVEKVLLSMLNNLDKNKFDIALNLNLYQGELRDKIPTDIKTTIFAGGKEDFPKNGILNKVYLVLRAAKLWFYRKYPQYTDQKIIKNNYDVEIATGYTMYNDVMNSTNKKSKKIGWLHSDLTLDGFAPIREQIFKNLQAFDYVIFGSQQSKDVLIETYPDLKLPPNKVILNAIPIEEIKQKAAEFKPDFKDIPTFVSVGRLHYRKGYRKLIEVHKELLDKGYQHQIIIVGGGEDYDLLTERAKELNVEDTFILKGTLMNPYPYVKNADFYIMPSESEGWPLIIAETLILKKPILATNVGGIPEMISHKENGYLMEDSHESIANGMIEFLENKSLLENINKGLENSEEQFNSKKIFDAVEEIILKFK